MVYKVSNKDHIFIIHPLENCNYKWAGQEHKRIDGSWIVESFKRFNDLDAAKEYVNSLFEDIEQE